jgi:hypothetical protein
VAFHPDITRKDDVTVALDTANAAVKLASRQMTGNAGSVTIPNADGTKTVLGVDAGDTGVAPWVGDTTAPGTPLGLSAESHNGAIWVTWNGTLDGGIPADFSHIQVTASYDAVSVDMGRLTAAGKVTAAELPAGAEVSITAIAYDDAHDANGNSTPNASNPSEPVSVVVQSAVDPSAVQQAQDDAQSALDKAGQASDTATTAKNTAEGASTNATNASNTATAAKTAADSANSTAASALATAQAAQNDGVTQWVPQYAQTTSPTSAPTTGWSNTAPDWVAGSYIWSRMIVAYGSGDYETTDPVVLTGNPGAQGDKGDPGKNGADGTSVTIKGRVSTAANLPSSASNGDGYITEDDGHLHVWGSTGFTDVGQFKGENGLNAYVHTAWANSADGKTDFSTTSGGTRAYMGQYNDNTVADSTDPTKYTWTKIKGADGAQGVGVASITPYWALGTAAPAKPAVTTPPSPWVSAEPGYQRNQNLYTTTKFTYDSGAFVYTNVQLDSSYQYSAAAETAAEDALQSATNAQTAAQTAQTAATNANNAATSAATKADNASSAATQAQSTAAAAAQAATSAQTAANLAIQNAQELLINGDFENGLNGWSYFNTSDYKLTLTTDQAHSGTHSVTSTGSQNTGIYSTNPMKVIPGRVYRIGYWAMGSAAATNALGFRIVTSPDGNTWTSSAPTNNAPAVTTSWTFYSVDWTCPSGVNYVRYRCWFNINGSSAGSITVYADDLTFKDVTEASAAQDAANTAQTAAANAATAAANAASIANAAQAAAQGAQTTADGKNKIFASTTEPSHTGLVPGDFWFQLNSSKQTTGIQVWNGSAFVNYMLLASALLIAGSVGTTQIANGAITTDLLQSNAVTAIKIAAQTITGDKLNVGSVASAIVTSGLFRTADSGARVVMDSAGIRGYNSSGATTFNLDASNGSVSAIGGLRTAASGNRVEVAQKDVNDPVTGNPVNMGSITQYSGADQVWQILGQKSGGDLKFFLGVGAPQQPQLIVGTSTVGIAANRIDLTATGSGGGVYVNSRKMDDSGQIDLSSYLASGVSGKLTGQIVDGICYLTIGCSGFSCPYGQTVVLSEALPSQFIPNNFASDRITGISHYYFGGVRLVLADGIIRFTNMENGTADHCNCTFTPYVLGK